MANGNRPLLPILMSLENSTHTLAAAWTTTMANHWQYIQLTGGKALVSYRAAIQGLQLSAYHVLDWAVSLHGKFLLWRVSNTLQEAHDLDQRCVGCRRSPRKASQYLQLSAANADVRRVDGWSKQSTA